jgi:glycosyltransferase involved in cell wall biosynthesis
MMNARVAVGEDFMRVLILAPQPFYQERGTPIAVDMLLKALSARGDVVDVLTYHLGTTPEYTGVTLYRIPRLAGIRTIRAGLSLKKLICDGFLYREAVRLVKKNRYDLVHAVEESAFMALAIKRKFGIPYVYDMDSSMSLQIIEKRPWLKFAVPLMEKQEARVIRQATAVIPVCPALFDIAGKNGATRNVLITDFSLLNTPAPGARDALRKRFGVKGMAFLYLGNLEHYQGIDLLMESFQDLLKRQQEVTLVIAGGSEADITRYRQKAGTMGIADSCRFIGPWPLRDMASIFEMADVLVSPRIMGNNTPMKIYSYLASGRPVIATRISSHTQVLSDEVALLCEVDAKAMARGMDTLIQRNDLRVSLSAKALKLADEKYSPQTFKRAVFALYADLESSRGKTSPLIKK